MSSPGTFDLQPVSLARNIAAKFARLPQVQAVVLSGSRSSAASDDGSDIDLYVYTTDAIPEQTRRDFAADARCPEIGNNFWEPGDEWIDGRTGIAVDVMYRDVRWIREQLDRVLVQHQASIGYTTCFWYNVLHAMPLFDRDGWFAALQQYSRQPYPQELTRAILAKNYPILHRKQSSYLHQIELAAGRADVFSLQHRVTALLASYFDIIFAVNQQPHPGEKRLIAYAKKLCRSLPDNMEEEVRAVLSSTGEQLVANLRRLLGSLDQWLAKAGVQAAGTHRS